MPHILTILEARVVPDKWEMLKRTYEAVDKNGLPSSVLSSYLTQQEKDPEVWYIVTIWESRQALDSYRKSVETPVWISVFRAVEGEPILTISEVQALK